MTNSRTPLFVYMVDQLFVAERGLLNILGLLQANLLPCFNYGMITPEFIDHHNIQAVSECSMFYPALSLDSLRDGHTIITADSAGYFIENCKVCFHAQNHQSGVILHVTYDDEEFDFFIDWEGSVTPAMIRAWRGEDRKNTEVGAIALTMLLLPKLTPYTAVESAGYGTGMDYVLVTDPVDDTLIFNHTAAYLEVTGIAKEAPANTVSDRIAEKKARIDKVRGKDANRLGDLPTMIVCVEFSRPLVRIVTYE